MKVLRKLPDDLGEPIGSRTKYFKDGVYYEVVISDGARMIFQFDEGETPDIDG